MGFISGRHFTKQRKKLLQANDKLYEGVELPTRNIRSSTEHQDYQVSTWVNDGGWKRSLAGEYRKSPAFAGYHIFVSAGHIEKYMEDAIFKFYETKKEDPIMAATNLFGNITNTHPFEDGNRRICHLILAHVLIQLKYCLFPVILSSFHGRGRRHYIRAVMMFDRKPSMLYTMIVKSLVHCWDNFEQNVRMPARCWHKNVGWQLHTDQKWPRRSPKFNKDVFCHAIFFLMQWICVLWPSMKSLGHVPGKCVGDWDMMQKHQKLQTS